MESCTAKSILPFFIYFPQPHIWIVEKVVEVLRVQELAEHANVPVLQIQKGLTPLLAL